MGFRFNKCLGDLNFRGCMKNKIPGAGRAGWRWRTRTTTVASEVCGSGFALPEDLAARLRPGRWSTCTLVRSGEAPPPAMSMAVVAVCRCIVLVEFYCIQYSYVQYCTRI